MKKKFSLILIALLLVLVLATSLVACGEDDDTPVGPNDGPSTDNPTDDGGDKPQGPKMWTVTLDMQDGTDPTTQQVEDGKPATFPAVSNTPYKTFKGWFKTSDGKGGLWSKSTPITADVTIYACWNQKYAGITYYLNYANAPAIDKEYQALGGTLTLPEDPERTYWIFGGWFTDKACTKPVDTTATLTKDINLYALWTLDPAHEHTYTGVVTPEDCVNDGYTTYTCPCTTTYVDDIVPAYGHSFTFSDTDYFGMVTCNNEGCEHTARKESERIYADKFVYTFDENKQAEIDGRYQSMLDILGSVEKYDQAIHAYEKGSALYQENQEFEAIFNAFYDDLMYLVEQYQYAYVFYCVDSTDKNTTAYETISEYRTDAISDFYALYRLIYESKFREYFFDQHEGGWTDEDIEATLIMSDSYGGDEYAEVNKNISDIEIAYDAIKSPDKSDEVPVLYENFVKYNNQIAQLAGYDNYPEYAYANVYGRDYTPQDVATMRSYVKSYFKNTYLKIYSNYYRVMTSGGVIQGTIESKYYNALTEDSVFNSKIATDLIKGYFETMQSDAGVAGAKEIDFYHHANELFKNGNYYTGEYEGAFNYWIPAQDTSILYFGPDSYSGAFTFIHEFGHYYNGIYNQGISMSYDLEETHSQANEMMFLSYLEDALPKATLKKIYDKIYYDNVFNMFAIIMLATAVDEFEYCVYTNTTPEGEPANYTAEDYDRLFAEIMASYGIADSLNTSYWRFVTIHAPSYYISYAMSALPCIELLTVAETEGFEVAQAKYFKFFTFTDDSTIVTEDEVGDKIITIGYGETLGYIGLHSIFDEALYSTISNYFSIDKDFTYAS